MQVTLFQEAGEITRQLKVGQKVRVGIAGADRKAVGEGVTAEVTALSLSGALGKVTLRLSGHLEEMAPAQVIRLWRL